jgi:hypothetical protein
MENRRGWKAEKISWVFRASTQEKFPSEISRFGYGKAVNEKRYRTCGLRVFVLQKNKSDRILLARFNDPYCSSRSLSAAAETAV